MEGGFSSSANWGVAVGGGLIHSSVMVAVSRWPMSFDGEGGSDEAGGVDAGVGSCCVAAGVFVDY